MRLKAPTIMKSVAWVSLCLATGVTNSFAQGSTGDDFQWGFGGHAKYQFILTGVPNDSVLQEISGSQLQDHNLEARFKVSARRGSWSLETHAQIINVYSETLEAFRGQQVPVFTPTGVGNDDRRWFNLTHELHNDGKTASVLRLDRASVAYTSNKTVLRFGRQAISWGNGLLFTPMDIFNPFDPTAVDKEYKTGDDMLYGQFLLEDGSDIQAVAVVRRNPANGNVEQDESSLAVKYHGFWGSSEYDLLLAEHYADRVVGLGLSADFDGAIWRGDLVWTDTPSDSVFSAVGGASYSWVAGGRNWSGYLEYHFNGFGQSGSTYSLSGLAGKPELLQRLARGELYNLGRHYLGGSLTVELTPLLIFTPNVFINLVDPSALGQLVLSYDWKQDLQVLGALSFPIGPGGSEYGGIKTIQPGQYLSTGPSLFLQLGWYF